MILKYALQYQRYYLFEHSCVGHWEICGPTLAEFEGPDLEFPAIHGRSESGQVVGTFSRVYVVAVLGSASQNRTGPIRCRYCIRVASGEISILDSLPSQNK
jgi:hypothetical protein